MNEFETIFSSCTDLASRLSDDQFSLFANMLLRFKKIQFESYLYLLKKAALQIPNPIVSVSRFSVAPIVAPKDVGKSKSGIMLIYPFQHSIWPSMSNFRGNNINARTEASRVGGSTTESQFTIFIDDFIGTGKTALEFIENYRITREGYNEKIVICCIAAMKSGIKKLKELGIEIYYSILAETAIKDFTSYSDKDKVYRILDSIESRLIISDDYKRGYMESEALISLIRTPNNTLPMFWCSKAKSGSSWPAPFWR